MTLDKQKMIRLAGILSIIAALLCAVSDLLLGCGPVSGKEISLENMAMIPYGRTMAGALLGAAVIPFWLLILFPLYEALKPAGKWFAVPVVFLLAHHIAIATLYHGAYAFYSAGYHALAAASGEAEIILSEMINEFMVFRTGLMYVSSTFLLASVWFMIAVLFRPTRYKRWMALFTPLLVIPIKLLCSNLPAPIGGYIVPPIGTIVYAVFFLITTQVSWNYNYNEESKIKEKNKKVDTEKLTGVPETLLIPLYLRAVETQRVDSIIRDEKAVEIIQRIEYDFAKFDKAWASQVGVAVRTEILDEVTVAFMHQYPDASVVNLGAGLCTRFNRVDNGRVTWYELDLPEAIELRRRFFTETDRHQFIEGSITDFRWMDQIKREEKKPVLFIGEGLFMYFEEREVKNVFVEMATRFPGAEVIFEINAPVTVGRSKHHDALSKTEGKTEFKWGPSSGAVCETWDDRIRFVEDWNYLDRHRDRFRFIRLFAYIPPLKRYLMNKIAHLRFREDRR